MSYNPNDLVLVLRMNAMMKQLPEFVRMPRTYDVLDLLARSMACLSEKIGDNAVKGGIFVKGQTVGFDDFICVKQFF